MVNSVAAASAGTPPAGSGAGAGAPAASFSGGDFQTFLKMLTTQIKNQDPLNPMEGSDFAVQLATFSGVEQQVRTNDLLAQIAAHSAGSLSAVSQWIGKEVRTTDPVAFDGSPLTLTIDHAPDADGVTLVTYDAAGTVVSREEVGPGDGEVDWVGRSENGTTLPAGLYSFRVESTKAGTVIETKDVGVYSRVIGGEVTASGIKLSLEGGASTMEADVTGLREPAD